MAIFELSDPDLVSPFTYKPKFLNSQINGVSLKLTNLRIFKPPTILYIFLRRIGLYSSYI